MSETLKNEKKPASAAGDISEGVSSPDMSSHDSGTAPAVGHVPLQDDEGSTSAQAGVTRKFEVSTGSYRWFQAAQTWLFQST